MTFGQAGAIAKKTRDGRKNDGDGPNSKDSKHQ